VNFDMPVVADEAQLAKLVHEMADSGSGGAESALALARLMSPSGQTEKNSVRAYVFRFALELGHCSMQSPLRICAISSLMHRSNGTQDWLPARLGFATRQQCS
jgi:hypothetical protein